jgi:hypothetical protein
MWYYILYCVGGICLGLFGLCLGARASMKYAWSKRKEELEVLKLQLEDLDNLTEELQLQKEEIEDLLKNEFRDFDALFKQKINVD